MPIMVKSGSGSPINAIQFDSFHIAWAQKLHHYALKRGQLYIDLYLNIIKLDSWVVLFYFITTG